MVSAACQSLPADLVALPSMYMQSRTASAVRAGCAARSMVSPSSQAMRMQPQARNCCRASLKAVPAIFRASPGFDTVKLLKGRQSPWLGGLAPKSAGYRKATVASFFGVGAPEALVIMAVALLVFGPKGLAEVAKTAGKTLKQFQPTIRELQQVSQDFKSTLEAEIGMDELRYPPPPSRAMKDTDGEFTVTDKMRQESLEQAWGQSRGGASASQPEKGLGDISKELTRPDAAPPSKPTGSAKPDPDTPPRQRY